MKPSTVLFTIAAVAPFAFADQVYVPAAQIQPEQSAESPEAENRLELRQNRVVNQDAVAATEEAPVVTTIWMQSQIASGTGTYLEYVVTQTFAAVPDQWPLAVAGSIGYGTLSKTKKKRDAEPTGR